MSISQIIHLWGEKSMHNGIKNIYFYVNTARKFSFSTAFCMQIKLIKDTNNYRACGYRKIMNAGVSPCKAELLIPQEYFFKAA